MRRDKAFAITFSYFFLVACYATLHPAISVRRLVGWSVPFLGSGLEGADDLCFHICRNFSFSFLISPPISRPKFQFQGPNPSLKAQILA